MKNQHIGILGVRGACVWNFYGKTRCRLCLPTEYSSFSTQTTSKITNKTIKIIKNPQTTTNAAPKSPQQAPRGRALPGPGPRPADERPLPLSATVPLPPNGGGGRGRGGGRPPPSLPPAVPAAPQRSAPRRRGGAGPVAGRRRRQHGAAQGHPQRLLLLRARPAAGAAAARAARDPRGRGHPLLLPGLGGEHTGRLLPAAPRPSGRLRRRPRANGGEGGGRPAAWSHASRGVPRLRAT